MSHAVGVLMISVLRVSTKRLLLISVYRRWRHSSKLRSQNSRIRFIWRLKFFNIFSCFYDVIIWVTNHFMEKRVKNPGNIKREITTFCLILAINPELVGQIEQSIWYQTMDIIDIYRMPLRSAFLITYIGSYKVYKIIV